MTSALKQAIYRASARWLAPIYSGLGSILMFHRVVDEAPPERIGWPAEYEISSAALEATVRRLRARGYAIVSIDELHEALRRPGGRRARLAVITFDDGYRDVLTRALPLLKALGAPFTLYVTTGFPDRTLAPWWYLAEELLLARSGGSIVAPGGGEELGLRTAAERAQAFRRVEARFSAVAPRPRMAMAAEWFGPEVVARRLDELYLGWAEIELLAAEPLVTLGAHTVTHPVLCALAPDEARREMAESKRILEARLGRPVRHFAYPYGSRAQVGAREFELAREAGFTTSVTTRFANVFEGSARHLQCLPRITGHNPEEIELAVTGAAAAFRYRGRRVVTV